MRENKQPENHQINMGNSGNYNESIEGDYIQGNIFNIFRGQALIPVGDPARSHNQRLLLADVKNEVRGRLKQSLHNATLINLEKESQRQQVKCPWDAEIKIGESKSEPIPHNTKIIDIFAREEIAGRLLILGEPGAGKTTTQLELAQALIQRAEQQPNYPVPVLLNLSSWKDERQLLADWIMAELKSKYGVSKQLATDWLQNRQLLFLLDGLDEVKPALQESCVKAINQLLEGEYRPQYLVVCSRREEYDNYETKIYLNGAIYLQSLTNNQIHDYLTAVNHAVLWQTINSDLNLLELVKTPLLLSITTLAFQEISIDRWQQLTSTTERLQYLLDAYVGRMLRREINSKTYVKKTPTSRQTRLWLVWLAQQMQRESRTEFLIEEMQPSWLTTKIKKINYIIVISLFFILIFLQENFIFLLFCEFNFKKYLKKNSFFTKIKTLFITELAFGVIFTIFWLLYEPFSNSKIFIFNLEDFKDISLPTQYISFLDKDSISDIDKTFPIFIS